MDIESEYHHKQVFCIFFVIINQVCLYEIDAFSKSHELGQVRIDMKDVDITQRMTGWFDLYEEEEEVWTVVCRQNIAKFYVTSTTGTGNHLIL